MGHEIQDRASLQMAKLIADGLPTHPEWLDLARDNLRRWMERNRNAPALLRCYEEWLELLERPMHEICSILIEESDNSRRLRQNSPFAGVLTPREVWQIKDQCRHDARTA